MSADGSIPVAAGAQPGRLPYGRAGPAADVNNSIRSGQPGGLGNDAGQRTAADRHGDRGDEFHHSADRADAVPGRGCALILHVHLLFR